MSNPYYAVFNEKGEVQTPPRQVEPGECIQRAFLDSDIYDVSTRGLGDKFTVDLVQWWDARRDEGWSVSMCEITKLLTDEQKTRAVLFWLGGGRTADERPYS